MSIMIFNRINILLQQRKLSMK